MCKKVSLVPGSAPEVQLTPGDRVLLVGINKYPGCPLQGCVNDVMDMADFLVDYLKFNPKDMIILTDERATTDAIMDKLYWLAQTPPGARAYFHYSGHGAQADTTDSTEPDLLSECICPIDFDWTPEHMIIDKTFVQIFSRMDKSVKFNWASDSCHSGDLDRDLVRRSKSYPLPPEIHWKKSKAPKMDNYIVRAIRSSTLNVGYISGCKSNQTSADATINGRPCGAFTHYYLKNLIEDVSQPLSTLAEKECNDLEMNGYEQRPQAEGLRKDKGLFLP